MANVTSINGDYEKLAAAMQPLAEMGYFASVEYDGGNTAVLCKRDDEETVLTIKPQSGSSRGEFSVLLRLDDGTEKTINISAAASTAGSFTPQFVYICSGGMYIAAGTSTCVYGYVIVSKTNNGKLGVIVPSASVTSSARLTPLSIAADDAPDQMDTAFAFGAPTLRNQTVLTDIPTGSAANRVSYFPDARYTMTSQYAYTSNTATPPFNFVQDGKRYLWVGHFAIRDEETVA